MEVGDVSAENNVEIKVGDICEDTLILDRPKECLDEYEAVAVLLKALKSQIIDALEDNEEYIDHKKLYSKTQKREKNYFYVLSLDATCSNTKDSHDCIWYSLELGICNMGKKGAKGGVWLSSNSWMSPIVSED